MTIRFFKTATATALLGFSVFTLAACAPDEASDVEACETALAGVESLEATLGSMGSEGELTEEALAESQVLYGDLQSNVDDLRGAVTNEAVNELFTPVLDAAEAIAVAGLELDLEDGAAMETNSYLIMEEQRNLAAASTELSAFCTE